MPINHFGKATYALGVKSLPRISVNRFMCGDSLEFSGCAVEFKCDLPRVIDENVNFTQSALVGLSKGAGVGFLLRDCFVKVRATLSQPLQHQA